MTGISNNGLGALLPSELGPNDSQSTPPKTTTAGGALAARVEEVKGLFNSTEGRQGGLDLVASKSKVVQLSDSPEFDPLNSKKIPALCEPPAPKPESASKPKLREKYDEVVRLFSEKKMKPTVIASELGMHSNTVYRILNKSGLRKLAKDVLLENSIEVIRVFTSHIMKNKHEEDAVRLTAKEFEVSKICMVTFLKSNRVIKQEQNPAVGRDNATNAVVEPKELPEPNSAGTVTGVPGLVVRSAGEGNVGDIPGASNAKKQRVAKSQPSEPVNADNNDDDSELNPQLIQAQQDGRVTTLFSKGVPVKEIAADLNVDEAAVVDRMLAMGFFTEHSPQLKGKERQVADIFKQFIVNGMDRPAALNTTGSVFNVSSVVIRALLMSMDEDK